MQQFASSTLKVPTDPSPVSAVIDLTTVAINSQLSAQLSAAAKSTDGFDLYASDLSTITTLVQLLAQGVKIGSIEGHGPIEIGGLRNRYLYAVRVKDTTAGLSLLINADTMAVSTVTMSVSNTIGTTSASKILTPVDIASPLTIELVGAAAADSVDIYQSCMSSLTTLAQAQFIGTITGAAPMNFGGLRCAYLYNVRTAGSTSGLTLSITGSTANLSNLTGDPDVDITARDETHEITRALTLSRATYTTTVTTTPGANGADWSVQYGQKGESTSHAAPAVGGDGGTLTFSGATGGSASGGGSTSGNGSTFILSSGNAGSALVGAAAGKHGSVWFTVGLRGIDTAIKLDPGQATFTATVLSLVTNTVAFDQTTTPTIKQSQLATGTAGGSAGHQMALAAQSGQDNATALGAGQQGGQLSLLSGDPGAPGAGGAAGAAGAVKIGVGTSSPAYRIIADATGLGFFGQAGVAKPAITGSKGGNAALASLITQLVALGLVSDSTT